MNTIEKVSLLSEKIRRNYYTKKQKDFENSLVLQKETFKGKDEKTYLSGKNKIGLALDFLLPELNKSASEGNNVYYVSELKTKEQFDCFMTYINSKYGNIDYDVQYYLNINGFDISYCRSVGFPKIIWK